jgi:hypothetical protein
MADDDRRVPATRDANRGVVQLHDNGLRAGNLIDQALSRLDETQAKALGVEAGKEALRLQARQAQQNIDYVTGKKVAEDHIETWDALNKGGRTTRQSVKSEINTGAGKMHIESKSGATCFVATAAYGDPNHPDVMFLRWYRDEVLARSIVGRAFTATYWKVGPHMARAIAPYPRARRVARTVISRLALALKSRKAGS